MPHTLIKLHASHCDVINSLNLIPVPAKYQNEITNALIEGFRDHTPNDIYYKLTTQSNDTYDHLICLAPGRNVMANVGLAPEHLATDQIFWHQWGHSLKSGEVLSREECISHAARLAITVKKEPYPYTRRLITTTLEHLLFYKHCLKGVCTRDLLGSLAYITPIVRKGHPIGMDVAIDANYIESPKRPNVLFSDTH